MFQAIRTILVAWVSLLCQIFLKLLAFIQSLVYGKIEKDHSRDEQQWIAQEPGNWIE